MDKSGESQAGVIVSEYEDLKLTRQSIWSFLYPKLQQYANLTAIVNARTGKSSTYKEFVDACLRWAKELLKYVTYDASDVVAVIMPNNTDYPIVDLGAWAVGAAISLIRYDFSPEIALDLLQEAKPKVLVIDSSLLEKFKVIFDQLPKGMKIFVRGSNESYPEGEDLQTVFSSGEIMDVEKAKKVSPETIGVVTCSSGTTGKPKSILLSHGNLINTAMLLTFKPVCQMKYAEGDDQDVLLVNLPNAHIFSISYYFMAAIYLGCKLIEFETDDLSELVDVVSKYKINVLTFRAYMIDALSRMGDLKEKMKTVESILNVGCPLNPKAAKKIQSMLSRDIFIGDGYGTSEIGCVTYFPLKGGRLGATGKLMPNVKAKLIDLNTGEPILTPFTKGELFFLSPGVMNGYLNNPEATKDAFDGDWFRTGDISYFDDEYYFYVIERYKDVISVGGKKVFPSAIENVMKQHSSVLDVGVVGVPEAKTREEVPKAFVIRSDSVTEEELKEFVKKNAADEAMYLRGGVQFVDTLPRNHLGKMLRKVLREMDWSGSSTF